MFNRFFISDPDKDDMPQGDGRLKRLIPSIITLGSMMCGLTAIQMAIGGQWTTAVLLIVFAAILDAMDGAIARLLKATSKFGAELDSLSDFLSFGIAPAIIMYLWILNDAGKIGWIATLVFVVAASLRLARFNSAIEDQDKKPDWSKYFFTGVPAPAGAGLLLMPLIVYLQLEMDLSMFVIATPLIGLWALIISALMVSRIPTFSSKQIRLQAMGLIPTLLIIALVLAMMIHAPWVMLTLVGLVYIALIPLSYRVYRIRQKRHEEQAHTQ